MSKAEHLLVASGLQTEVIFFLLPLLEHAGAEMKLETANLLDAVAYHLRASSDTPYPVH